MNSGIFSSSVYDPFVFVYEKKNRHTHSIDKKDAETKIEVSLDGIVQFGC